MIGRRAGLGAILATLALLHGTPVAHASHRQLSIVEDDARLVLSGPAARDHALDDAVALGADTIRVLVSWKRIAPSPLTRTRPRGFEASDPAAYRASAWDGYDDLIRAASARGIGLLLSPAGPIPYWASRCTPQPSGSLGRCRPDMTQFKRFVQALGTRYSGTYADENEGGGKLPRISSWSVWNEPNQGGWLQPQYTRVGGRTVARSPVIYRALVRSAIAGLRAAGHYTDDVLLGETAPLGRAYGSLTTRPIAPVDFLRDVFCLRPDGGPMIGRAAADMDCRGFRRLAVTGISHHPYTRGGSKPPTTKGAANEITISSVARLKTIIHQAAAHHRISSHLPIYYTEYGFQTNPPDSLFGVSLLKQAAYINESDWMAYKDPGIRSVAQYQLNDEPNLAGFQTGLRFVNGTSKPSFIAYRFPIWVTRSGTRIHVWGQLRPAPDGAAETVEIQNASNGGAFTTVARAQTNFKGFVDATLHAAGPRWRLSWAPANGDPPITSRVARVSG